MVVRPRRQGGVLIYSVNIRLVVSSVIEGLDRHLAQEKRYRAFMVAEQRSSEPAVQLGDSSQ